MRICRCPQVVLKLKPHSGEGVREVTLKREKIKINPVTTQLCGSASRAVTEADPSAEAPAADGAGKIGYIRVATFSKQTPDSARAALQKLRADGADRLAYACSWITISFALGMRCFRCSEWQHCKVAVALSL